MKVVPGTTFVDCGSGVAGDMLLGALIDLGLSVEELNRTLHGAIPLKDWEVVAKRTERRGWPARSVAVKGDRTFGSGDRMRAVVRRSRLPEAVRSNSLRIFDRLLNAEKKAHGSASKAAFDPDGLGLLDTLVDVVGSAWGFWRLGVEQVAASRVNTGRIAPATAAILKECKIPVYSDQSEHELATPTGIAILSVIAGEFGPMPALQIQSAGYGAGLRNMPSKPNILAIYRGSSIQAQGDIPREPVILLETVIDDMDPRLYPHVSDLLMKAGALDAWWVSAGMKKGRPGIAYSVLCRPEHEKLLVPILFAETTTLGIRRLATERWTLPRCSGGMRKFARLPGGGTKSQVEFELARQKALTLSLPLRKLLK